MTDEEYYKACGAIFIKSDLNADKVISFAEFTPMYLAVHPQTPFMRATRNQWNEMFNLYDGDGNKSVSWPEAWKLFEYKERFDLMPTEEESTPSE